MSKKDKRRSRPLWDRTSPAITPTSPLPEHLKTIPDLIVEEILFRSYLREKERAERYLADLLTVKAQLKGRRTWARIQRLTKLRPNQKENE